MKKKILSTAIAGVLGLSMLTGVAAQESAPADVEVVNNPQGGLEIFIDAADFDAVPYSLQDQQTNADIVVTVTDDRGSDLGWNVTISGTNFTDGTNSFDVENLVLSSDATVTGNPGSPEGITATGGPVPEGPDSLKIASVERGGGTGEFTVTFSDSELTIPGGTLVGEYQSTLTVSVATGP